MVPLLHLSSSSVCCSLNVLSLANNSRCAKQVWPRTVPRKPWDGTTRNISPRPIKSPWAALKHLNKEKTHFGFWKGTTSKWMATKTHYKTRNMSINDKGVISTNFNMKKNERLFQQQQKGIRHSDVICRRGLHIAPYLECATWVVKTMVITTPLRNF